MNRDYSAVVFDMDGVIFDSEKAVLGCWIELAGQYDIPNIEKTILACMGTTKIRTREIIMEAYGDDFPYDKYAGITSKMFHDRYDGGRLPIKKGVRELLEYLKEQGKKIALASSTRTPVVEQELKEAGLLNYFDVVVGGDMVKNSKPAPDIFIKACEQLGVATSDALAIEDSYNGIEAAFAGRLRPIMVPDLLPPNDRMNQITEVIIDDLLKVKEYLSK